MACGARQEAPSAPPVPLAIEARPPAASFQLGINEALAVPAARRSRLAAEALHAELAEDGRQVRALGARLVRAHTYNFPRVSCDRLARDPTLVADMDAWVDALGHDLEGVGMLSPWPANQTAATAVAYLPADLDAWGACVTSLVERYDGDGVDDMPGLRKPVRYWEVDNEPDLKNTTRARNVQRGYDPATFCTPGEYALVLTTAARAIRAASPESRILALGLYRPHAASGQAYAKAVLAQPGVRESFDILSLHTYHDDDGERLARGILAVSSLVPEKPVWVTEASVTLEAGPEVQARRVASQVAWAAMAGAERFFWHTLADPPLGEDGKPSERDFGTNSLLQAVAGKPAAEKPAGTVFRLLASELARHELSGAIPDGPGAARLRDGSTLLFAGSRTATAGGRSLRSGRPIPPGTTAEAPAWLDASPLLDSP
jgi:hypothetical protein